MTDEILQSMDTNALFPFCRDITSSVIMLVGQLLQGDWPSHLNTAGLAVNLRQESLRNKIFLRLLIRRARRVIPLLRQAFRGQGTADGE